MHKASAKIRKICLGLLLTCVPIGRVQTANASVQRTRHRRAGVAATRHRLNSSRHRLPSRHGAGSSFLHASMRIPRQLRASASQTFPPPVLPQQEEQRIPRQVSRKTAALQGIVRDNTARGVVGAMIALTNRATGATRTISADADGVFRLTELAPGTYLLLVQSDGFEKLTRDDLRLGAGDVVTIEMTLVPSA